MVDYWLTAHMQHAGLAMSEVNLAGRAYDAAPLPLNLRQPQRQQNEDISSRPDFQNMNQSADQPLRRIAKIEVTGLFGLYHHTIALNTDERITIIHGPNGIGKTVLLRMIVALFSKDYPMLLKTIFQSFTVTFTDGISVQVRRITRLQNGSQAGGSEFKVRELQFSASLQEYEPYVWNRRGPVDSRRIALYLSRAGYDFVQISENNWVNRGNRKTYTTEALVSEFPGMLPFGAGRAISAIPSWLATISSAVKVHLVETQRLLDTDARLEEAEYGQLRRGHTPLLASTVKNYARAVHRQITDNLTIYAKQSQTLDQSFPQRMLEQNLVGLEVTELKERMLALEDKRRELKRIGLIDEALPAPFNIDALDATNMTQRAVMTLYIEDTETKLGTLADLARRITLLVDKINKKFKHKSIGISKSDGLVAWDNVGNALDLDALSSGEQHEIVLMYDLLFSVKPNSLVLIDEPELSLHVIWQKAFLNDLLEVIQAANFDVLLATHSPFIVGDRDDLEVALSPEIVSSDNGADLVSPPAAMGEEEDDC